MSIFLKRKSISKMKWVTTRKKIEIITKKYGFLFVLCWVTETSKLSCAFVAVWEQELFVYFYLFDLFILFVVWPLQAVGHLLFTPNFREFHPFKTPPKTTLNVLSMGHHPAGSSSWARSRSVVLLKSEFLSCRALKTLAKHLCLSELQRHLHTKGEIQNAANKCCP